MRKTSFLLFIVHHSCACMAAAAEMPAELGRFVERGARLLTFGSADLNADGTRDYVVVLQRDDETGSRPLLIVGREKNGALKLLKRNDIIVECETCGGSMGDPFQSLEVRDKGFIVSNAGGSIDRWSNSFEFKYSHRDKTWQLVRAEVTSYSAPDAGATEKTDVYLPPRDFGKIDISDFDPDGYLKAR
jgi:hypothetical protein